jgi:hypothetical protein
MTILAAKLLEGVHVFEGGELDEVFTFPILHTQRKISCKPPIAICVVAEHARCHVVGHRVSAEGDAHGCPLCGMRVVAPGSVKTFLPRLPQTHPSCIVLGALNQVPSAEQGLCFVGGKRCVEFDLLERHTLHALS